MYARPARSLGSATAAAVRRIGMCGVAAGLVIMLGSGTAVAITPSAVATSPATVGLFGSQDPTYDGVYRQSLAIIGLVASGHQPDANAVTWLLNQQCADGSFTAYRADLTAPCTSAVEDENATAAAIQALVAIGKPTATAIVALKTFQLADGGFYDNTAFGPPASDANSTGLALSAFVAAGVDPTTVISSGGKTGDDYLRSLQIDCAAASGAGAFDFQGEPTLHANDYATVQALLGQLGKSLPVAPPSVVGPAPACPALVTDAASSATAALSYLAARLVATGGAIPSGFGSGTDWTTTANAVLDLRAAGVGAAATTAGLAALQANTNTYITSGGSYIAGPLATLIMVAHATGTDPTTFGGVDLVSVLGETEQTAPLVLTTVAPAAAPAAPTLPATGTRGVLPLSIIGTALIGLGVAALVASRRRFGTHQG